MVSGGASSVGPVTNADCGIPSGARKPSTRCVLCMCASRLGVWRRKVAAEKDGDVGTGNETKQLRAKLGVVKGGGYRGGEVSIRSLPVSACRDGGRWALIWEVVDSRE